MGVPAAFAGNLVEALRISWARSKQAGEELEAARQQEASQRRVIAHQLEQLAHTRELAHVGSRTAELGHDLRNPLTAAILSLSYLEERAEQGETVPPGELRDVLGIAQKSLDDVVALVQRIQAPAGERADRAPVDMQDLAMDALALVEPMAGDREVRFAVDTGAEHWIVIGDRIDLARVVINLLNNALQATVGTADPWVELGLRDTGSQIVVTVVDSGPTPPPAVLDEMFRRGFTTKVQAEGHGLGLAISRRIAQSHGGTLTVDRDAAHTTLQLRLPRAPAAPRSPDAPATPPQASAPMS